MMKLLAKVWLRVCPVRRIYVKFYNDCGWVPARAYFGVYYSHFPLRLTIDGRGIALRGGFAGTGRPYPFFLWCPRKRRAAN